MAHFQLGRERASYSTNLGGGRLLKSGAGTDTIFIELGKTVSLQLIGAGNSSPAITQFVMPTSGTEALIRAANFMTGRAGAADIVTVRNLGNRVSLTALLPGSCMLLIGDQPALLVQVGRFESHANMEHDLIANVYRSADPEKMHELNRMMFNDPENLFNENSSGNRKKWGDLACGTVSKVGGAALFFPKLDYGYKEYYKTPIVGKTRADIKIDGPTLERGRNALAARLAKGQPSIVGLIYMDGAIQRGTVNVTGGGGHTVLVVGCSSDKRQFLYIDVWQDGSKLQYTGGYAGRALFPNPCTELGLFEMKTDPMRGIQILRSTTPGDDAVFQGSQFLEVVAGPLA